MRTKTVYEYLNVSVFADRVVAAMESRHTTNEQLAYDMDCCKDSISKYRTGKGLPTLDQLVNLADCLNVSIDYLLGRKEDMSI